MEPVLSVREEVLPHDLPAGVPVLQSAITVAVMDSDSVHRAVEQDYSTISILVTILHA